MALRIQKPLKLRSLAEYRPQIPLLKIKIGYQRLYAAAYNSVVGPLEQAKIVVNHWRVEPDCPTMHERIAMFAIMPLSVGQYATGADYEHEYPDDYLVQAALRRAGCIVETTVLDQIENCGCVYRVRTAASILQFGAMKSQRPLLSEISAASSRNNWSSQLFGDRVIVS